MARPLILTALLIAACNEPFSNEDLLYLKALPAPEQVTVEVPGTATSTSGLGNGEQAALSAIALKTSRDLNGVTAFVLSTVQQVAATPPSVRDESTATRVWGPFRDPKTNVEFLMTIRLVETATTIKTTSTSTPAEIRAHYAYALNARRAGTSDAWATYFAGAYAPGDDHIERGMGYILLNLEAVRALEGKEDARGVWFIGYDDRHDQRTIQMGIDLVIDPMRVLQEPEAGYHYNRAANGRTTFYFIWRETIPDIQPDTGPELFNISALWDADNRGLAQARIFGGDLGAAVYEATECWDPRFKAVFRAGNLPNITPLGSFEACPLYLIGN